MRIRKYYFKRDHGGSTSGWAMRVGRLYVLVGCEIISGYLQRTYLIRVWWQDA